MMSLKETYTRPCACACLFVVMSGSSSSGRTTPLHPEPLPPRAEVVVHGRRVNARAGRCRCP